MTDDSTCVICEFASSTPDGGWVYEDERWVLGILSGLEVPGWLVLALRRHDVGATAMDVDEAASFGPLVVTISGAIQSATNAERVYLLAYGENAAHWHVLFAPRGAHIPPEHRHAEFWLHRTEYLDPPCAKDAAARVKTALDPLKASQLVLTYAVQ